MADPAPLSDIVAKPAATVARTIVLATVGLAAALALAAGVLIYESERRPVAVPPQPAPTSRHRRSPTPHDGR